MVLARFALVESFDIIGKFHLNYYSLRIISVIPKDGLRVEEILIKSVYSNEKGCGSFDEHYYFYLTVFSKVSNFFFFFNLT